MRNDYAFYGLLGFHMFLIAWNGRSSDADGWIGWLAAGGAAVLAVASIVLIHGHVQLAYTRGNTDGFREGVEACAERERRERAARGGR